MRLVGLLRVDVLEGIVDGVLELGKEGQRDAFRRVNNAPIERRMQPLLARDIAAGAQPLAKEVEVGTRDLVIGIDLERRLKCVGSKSILAQQHVVVRDGVVVRHPRGRRRQSLRVCCDGGAVHGWRAERACGRHGTRGALQVLATGPADRRTGQPCLVPRPYLRQEEHESTVATSQSVVAQEGGEKKEQQQQQQQQQPAIQRRRAQHAPRASSVEAGQTAQ